MPHRSQPKILITVINPLHACKLFVEGPLVNPKIIPSPSKKLEPHFRVLSARPREIFRGFSALWFLKYLGQFLSALAISGHSERFSPGKIRSEVGRPEGLFKAIGWPTSECILPGENLSEWPEIARALGNWPKYFKNHRAENPRKISRGLVLCHCCCFWAEYLALAGLNLQAQLSDRIIHFSGKDRFSVK